MGATPQLEEAVDGLDLFAMHDIRDGDGATFVSYPFLLQH